MSARHRSSSSVRADLLDLSRHLRQERLYVQHEKAQLQELNDKVKLAAEKLAHTAWVAHQQRDNLHGLVFSSRRSETSPAVCCLRSNLLEQTNFQDAYKHLNYSEIVYSEFLRALREKPKLLATCLVAGDTLSLPLTPEIVSTIFSGLYGNCLMAEDEQLVLKLLHHLMKLQLTTASNPRKLLRQGSCAFSRLYKAFNEALFSAKLFLTSALYDPILSLLTDDEIFLDIDPAKAIVRFSPQDRIKKFGKEGTPEFEANMKEHRAFIIAKLEMLTNRFIEGIRNNLHCFPPSLARLLRTMYSLLMSSGRVEPREVNAVCVDVIFDLFICPAMVDPNPVGIIDTPISYIARSNLMQVAQILQVLALWKWEEIDPRFMDLYSRFDKEAMSSVLEAMLEAGEMSEEAEDAHEMGAFSADFSSDGGSLLARLAVLLTRSQLENLIAFFRTLRDSPGGDIDANELTSLLAPLPESLPGSNSATNSLKLKSDDQAIASDSSKTKKQALAARLSTVANSVSNASRSAAGGSKKSEAGISDESGANHVDENGLIPREAETVLVIPVIDSNSAEPPGFISEEHVLTRSRQASRVVRMNLANLPGGAEPGGSEENSSFISGVAGEKRTRFSLSHDEGSIGNASDNLEAISEAASNHSVDSSLEDEVDQVEDPIIDNLSDMVSANVSGRGTPNVSGRDTPSSQVTEGEELAGRGAGNNQADDRGDEEPVPEGEGRNDNDRDEPDAAAPPPQAGARRGGAGGGGAGGVGASVGVGGGRKNGEPDLEEKFGRFEIKPPPRPVASHMVGSSVSEQGDETVSMVSDTWSTDVLASDTETLGENDGRSAVLEDLVRNNLGELSRNRLLDELVVPPATGNSSLASASAANLLDIAETASEAWSMDVLASDSESLRLGELDNEDTASVARSDDTRFTDDTTRSDPEPLLDVSVSSMSSGQGSMRGRREVDVTMLKRVGSSSSSDAVGQFRPSRAAAVEQWARQSSGNSSSRSGGSSVSMLPRRGSDSSGIGLESAARSNRRVTLNENSILKKPSPATAMAPSQKPLPNRTGLNGPTTADDSILSSASDGAFESLPSTSKSPAAEASRQLEVAVGTPPAQQHNHPQSLLDTENPPPSALHVTRSAPNSATGAIPKSISFDKTVYDSGSFDSADPHGSNKHGKSRDRNSFFRSFKLPKIGKNSGRGGSGNVGGAGGLSNSRSAQLKSEEYIRSSERLTSDDAFNIPEDAEGPLLRRAVSDETSDDILAKYRKKSSSTNGSELVDGVEVVESQEEPDERLVIDPNNVEGSFAFQDAKRKLRLMLSVADPTALSCLPLRVVPSTAAATGSASSRQQKEESEIIWFLRVQLAEAYNLQDRGMVAQLHETLRCMSLFDADGCRKLLRSLKEDYKRRTPYLSYLVRCRQGLLTTLAQQQRFLSRMEVDKRICSQYLVSVCIRLFLEKRESRMQQFVQQFKEIDVADEKIALMERFLALLWTQLEEDPAWALVVSEEQMKLGRLTIERAVVSLIYQHAMYPNGEADVSRDAVLSQHIQRLSASLTPSHRDLRVPRQYHYEAPWPSAQAEIRRLPAYKTASDKVSCVVRCSQTIMNLLSLASSKSVPAADDFVPVMVFVLIKANPTGLLSTVQYVDSFYGNRLSGEDQYWWMQFAAAIEFIKTMDYQV